MSNAQSIIDAIREDASVEEIGDGGTVFAVGHGRQIVDLEAIVEKYADQPRRKKGAYVAHDAATLLAYVEKHDIRGAAEIWADYPASTITAVINAHGSNAAEFEDHRIVYRVVHTEAWKAWIARDGHLLDQNTFAEHIEDRAVDIVKPSAADMLEIAQTFHATNNVQFESATRLSDGQRQLRYREQVNAKAGRAGDLTIPERFTLGLRPFEGADAFKIAARLRYRITDGALRIGYRLDRPSDVLRDAFGGVVDQIKTADIAPVLLGSRLI